MNAHVMVGPFELKFNSASVANEINKWDFHMLPFKNQDIVLDTDQAFYLYGGRKSLLEALNQQKNFRIIGDNWEQLGLFRASRKVAGGTKTKQLLMIAPVPDGIPAALKPYMIPLSNKNTVSSLFVHSIMEIITKLSK